MTCAVNGKRRGRKAFWALVQRDKKGHVEDRLFVRSGRFESGRVELKCENRMKNAAKKLPLIMHVNVAACL